MILEVAGEICGLLASHETPAQGMCKQFGFTCEVVTLSYCSVKSHVKIIVHILDITLQLSIDSITTVPLS